LVVEESAQQAMIRRLAAANSSAPLGMLVHRQSLVPVVELTSGLIFAVLMAGAVTLAQTAYRQSEALREAQEILETRVAERTEALAQANDALKEVAGWQRGFLREALASVTEGKLRLCDSPADLPPHGASFYGNPIFLTAETGLSDLRCQALETAALCNFAPERAQDLVTAVNEASWFYDRGDAGAWAQDDIADGGPALDADWTDGNDRRPGAGPLYSKTPLDTRLIVLQNSE